MKRFFLTLCALCATTALWAATATVDGITWTYTVSNGKATIEGYNDNDGFVYPAIPSSTSGSITIPSWLGGYPVTSIGSYTFWSCESLTSVTIPSSVTSIGDYAFRYCWGLTSVTIPDSVTSIEAGAFSYCLKLKFVVDENNPNYASQDGGLFNKAMTTLIRGPGATALYTIPSSVTSIGKHAFSSCSGLISLSIPEGVTSIGDWAFDSCLDLTSVTIPEGVTSIGDGAFVSCLGLTSVTIPDSVTSIGSSAFNGCSSLTSVTIPEGVTSIGYGVFDGSGLTSVTIPDGVTSIGGCAFYWCSALTSVEFLGAPPSVGAGAFSGVTATGTYLSKYASEWEAVISNGKWNGLTMQMVEVVEVVFDANGGEGGEVVTLEKGSALTAPTVSREGYSLTGWAPDVPATVPDEDTTYTAQWQVNKYLISFAIREGEGGTAMMLEYGSTLTPPLYFRPGYTLIGWSPELPETVPAENVTYTAQWKINQYTQTFDANGGVGGTSVTLDYGSSLTPPTVSREEHVFLGWSPEVPDTVPAANTTYTAQWQINQYTVTFDANGGEGGTSVTQDYGSVITAPEVSREGYIFLGWSPEVPVSVPASDVTCIAQWQDVSCLRYTIDGGVATITGLQAVYPAALEIPEAIGDAPVVTIAERAFAGCTNLTSVTIPDGVTSIESKAFYECWGLTSVTIPSSVTSIGDEAFSYCSGLTSVTIPEGVTSIGSSAFMYCSGLTSVPIPSSVTSIGSWAFWYCSGLTSVTIPEGVTSIGGGAFSNCSGLTSITIPEGMTSIGYSAFGYCTGLTSVTIPSSVTSIDDWVFSWCTGLTSVTIPSSVTSIGDGAFCYCESLTSVTIPEGVTSIGDTAFSECSGLTSLTIPSSVTSIEWGAFRGCSSLKEIYISDLAAWCAIEYDESGLDPSYDVTNFYLNGDLITDLVIPEGVTSIRNCAFSCCTGLTSVTIPDSVTSIGNYAFYNCSGLTSITIPSSVTSIGYFAFSGCSALTSLTIPEGVTSIEYAAFEDCTGLTSLTIPSSVTSIESGAFGGCSGLTSVTILGPPPTSFTSHIFPATTGYYSAEYAAEWEAVIVNGRWKSLTMQMVEEVEIIFDANGGEGGEVVTLESGSVLTAPQVSREGYTFVGWSPEMPAIVPNEDTTYTAQWQEILISFKVALTAVGGGTVTGVDQYAEGASVTVTAIPQDGYVFCGWGTTPAVMTPEYTFTMPAEDVTLTAYFAPKQVVDQAVQQHVTENGLISKDEIKEMAFETPVVEVGSDEIEISISLQTAETLNAWEAMALQGATLEVDEEAGKVRVRVPKGDKKAAFYKFVVPTDQSK